MNTKSTVFLGVIICGFLVGQLVPISAIIGFPVVIIFTAFFVPYFGFKKCFAIVMVFAIAMMGVNFQRNTAINLAALNIFQEIGNYGFNDITNTMKTNMSAIDYQGNITQIKNSVFYKLFIFATTSDP